MTVLAIEESSVQCFVGHHQVVVGRKIKTDVNPTAQGFEKLPDELVIHIFSYLDTFGRGACAQVSRRFNRLATDGSLWKYLDYFSCRSRVTSMVLMYCAKKGSAFVRGADLRGCTLVTDEGIASLAHFCCNMESLILKQCVTLTDGALWHVAKFKYLNHLDLTGCRFSDVGLSYLASGCRRLEELIITPQGTITEDGLVKVLRNTRLHRLSCTTCPWLTDLTLRTIGDNCYLHTLNIQGSENITDAGIQYMVHRQRGLFSLLLGSCPSITDISLIAIANYLGNLENLDVSCCGQLTDRGFRAIIQSCRRLVKIDVSECGNITDRTIIGLADLPFLEILHASYCEQLTDASLVSIAAKPFGSRVLRLSLDNCPRITDEGIKQLIYCPGLRKVEVYDCSMVTRSAIRTIRNNLPDLMVHAYFAPVTPPPAPATRNGYCRCCVIL